MAGGAWHIVVDMINTLLTWFQKWLIIDGGICWNEALDANPKYAGSAISDVTESRARSEPYEIHNEKLKNIPGVSNRGGVQLRQFITHVNWKEKFTSVFFFLTSGCLFEPIAFHVRQTRSSITGSLLENLIHLFPIHSTVFKEISNGTIEVSLNRWLSNEKVDFSTLHCNFFILSRDSVA